MYSTSMENPKLLVSILIFTYNHSTLLKRAINGVLAQDFIYFELIIIDDCSLDDTPDVVNVIKMSVFVIFVMK